MIRYQMTHQHLQWNQQDKRDFHLAELSSNHCCHQINIQADLLRSQIQSLELIAIQDFENRQMNKLKLILNHCRAAGAALMSSADVLRTTLDGLVRK